MMLRLILYLTFALLTTRRSTRSTPMPDTIFEDTPADNGTGDVIHSDERPVLKPRPSQNVDVFLNYKVAFHPDGDQALRVWANGQYIDITAAQAQQIAPLLMRAAPHLADIRQDIGGES